jgi:putative acetyltransferase
MKLKIQRGDLTDLEEIQKLFQETVTSICRKDYDEAQIEAWISSAKNHERWFNLIKDQYFIVAKSDGQIVGFASLYKGNYIDVLFVHKDFQRMGIARQLYAELEKEAKRLNSLVLTSDVSKTAKAFFESHNFTVLKKQIQVRQQVKIVNYKMQKEL